MDGNPDNDIETTGSEIATTEQRRLHRADQKRRLQVQVERALRALEAVPDPKDFASVERMRGTTEAKVTAAWRRNTGHAPHPAICAFQAC